MLFVNFVDLVHRFLSTARTKLPQKNLSTTASFFSATDDKNEKSRNGHPYSPLMIDRGNRILIVFNLFCCSKHKLSTILRTNISSLVRFIMLTFRFKKLFKFFFLFYLYDWITIMAYSKHELGAINMLCFPKKKLLYYTPTSP